MTRTDRTVKTLGQWYEQYHDTGRLFLYSEDLPAPNVMLRLQQSGSGIKANVPIPQELADAPARIPGCIRASITPPS